MARLLGIEIPNEKRIAASLPYIYGIGGPTAKRLLDLAGIDPDLRTGELSDEQLSQLAWSISPGPSTTVSMPS